MHCVHTFVIVKLNLPGITLSLLELYRTTFARACSVFWPLRSYHCRPMRSVPIRCSSPSSSNQLPNPTISCLFEDGLSPNKNVIVLVGQPKSQNDGCTGHGHYPIQDFSPTSSES